MSDDLLSACCGGVFGDSLCALRDSVLGQFTGQEKTDSSLDLSRGDCRALVVLSQASRFARNTLEDVVNERIHDAHGLRRDASVRVNLLENLFHKRRKTRGDKL